MSIHPITENKNLTGVKAPWAGAEERWRAGIVPPPVARKPESFHLSEDGQPLLAVPNHRNTLSGLTLTAEELQVVRTSLPPTPEMAKRSKKQNPWKLTSIISMTAVVCAVALVMYQSASGSELPVSPKAAAPVVLAQPVDAGVSQVEGAEVVSAAPAPSVAETEESLEFSLAESLAVMSSPARKLPTARAAATAEPAIAPQDTVAIAGVTNTNIEIAGDPIVESAKSESGELSVPDNSIADASAEGELKSAAVVNAVSIGGNTQTSQQPVLPSREYIRTAMDEVRGDIEKCRMGVSGRMVVEMVIAGETGKVVSSRVIDKNL